MTLGMITVGQSPRKDITEDLKAEFRQGVRCVERGALDNYRLEEAQERFAPEEGEPRLVSRMRDGRQVCFAEKYALPLVQECIDRLEEQGCSLLLLLCTGELPGLHHQVPLIKPQEVLPGIVKAMSAGDPLGLIIPSEDQRTQIRRIWGTDVPLKIETASPYGDPGDLIRAAEALKAEKVRLVYMDCMGYTPAMRERVNQVLGEEGIVLLPRTLIARIVNDQLNGSVVRKHPMEGEELCF